MNNKNKRKERFLNPNGQSNIYGLRTQRLLLLVKDLNAELAQYMSGEIERANNQSTMLAMIKMKDMAANFEAVLEEVIPPLEVGDSIIHEDGGPSEIILTQEEADYYNQIFGFTAEEAK